MGKASRAAIVCLLALAAAELGLRACERAAATARAVRVERPVLVLVGTSRTLRGIRPDVVEEELRAVGGPVPWVANASLKGATAVGLLRLAREEVLPYLEGARGWVGIELNGPALNDARVTDDEQPWVPRSGLPSAGALGALGRLRAGDVDGFADAVLDRLDLVRARSIWEGFLARDEDAPPCWSVDERGYEPWGKMRWSDLHARYLRDRYRNEMLAGYALGGLQTEAVAALVAEARAAGLEPFLYVLPITDTQRGFWTPEGYATYLAHARELAAALEVRFFDLDTGHDLPDEAFYDANHLHDTWAEPFSRTFARRVVARLGR